MGHNKFGGSVNSYEKMELAFLGSDFGNVDVEEAYRVRFELLFRRFVPFAIRQTADAMTLKASMQ